MFESRLKQKGVVLYITIMVIFLITALANVVMNIMRSQATLTQHQINRIQAYYAGLGAVNYAMDLLTESLTRNPLACWPNDPNSLTDQAFLITICRDAANPSCGGACDFIDESLPVSIERIEIDAGNYTSANPLFTRQLSIRTFYSRPTP